MNYLAHLYLSGDNKKIMVGNFMADSIKGRKVNDYKGDLRKGILMHRWIDQFMDTHEITAKSRARFYSTYHHYSGVVLDVVYDHFLAKDWNCYSSTPLWRYSIYCYCVLICNWFVLPIPVKGYLPNLVLKRRLTAYAKLDGIADSLRVMSRTSSLPDKTDEAISIIQKNYDDFRSEFHAYFKEILETLPKMNFE